MKLVAPSRHLTLIRRCVGPNHAQISFIHSSRRVAPGPLHKAVGSKRYFAARQHHRRKAGFLHHSRGEPWGCVWIVQRLAFAVEDRTIGAVLDCGAGDCVGAIMAQQSYDDRDCGWIIADSWWGAGESLGPFVERA